MLAEVPVADAGCVRIDASTKGSPTNAVAISGSARSRASRTVASRLSRPRPWAVGPSTLPWKNLSTAAHSRLGRFMAGLLSVAAASSPH